MKPLRLLLLAALTAFPVFADGVRITFSSDRYSKSDKLPDGWVLKGKLFTAKPTYEVVYDKDLKTDVLRIRADRASGTLLYDITGILQKYPIMRWKWRVDSLPKDADGRSGTIRLFPFMSAPDVFPPTAFPTAGTPTHRNRRAARLHTAPEW